MDDILDRARRVRLVIFDVDGVLTDGSLFIGDDGQEYKAFNSRDGHGMKMLRNSGVEVAIITGRTSEVVKHRVADLGITHVYQGQLDKVAAFEHLVQRLGMDHAQTAYVGDDVVDLPVMRRVGFAVAVQDAHELVRKHAHWQTPNGGGRGAARDVCELIMEAQGNLEAEMHKYF
ncbi:MAG: 3-deoxy-manno-octulosonate-8-phosphatase KdsC [Gammaproteobacteria bacterium]|nr:3-deoxy-manno-octulosonate-8-phosphatase KdsC [Gammaproteobacteria bacterium]NIR98813.1 3-deoxy-manno-octulosonate-8-phosphatase KdsC [Gammaproteobacteria bacterium]NIT64523.1 3-deoxy-manno-octulosonate-8-phosphatase KdsC [Gammaproteobacteria bacterium]NIV21443.1 3-deoxy-manno-octulosonate-8-phosphatase KdsC [Gammaproteobacteria bacterium]NIX11313.1 3-deoxy-manno-octulosonate-8-phosphatase KdsC [Gammaproteobacteria bacterium]